jgi:DNA-binding transcriptional ArsR family regulator
MRKIRAVEALFPKTRRDLLGATHGQADRWWYLSELAGHLSTTPSSLQRELQSLVSCGILRQRRDGKRIYFQADEKSSIFAEIRGIVAKTLGIVDVLENVLDQFEERIACACVYGGVAGLREGAAEEIDLLVIGAISLADLSTPLLALETRFNVDFDVTCYSAEEFRERRDAQADLLMKILGEEKLFLVGDEDGLETLSRSAST